MSRLIDVQLLKTSGGVGLPVPPQTTGSSGTGSVNVAAPLTGDGSVGNPFRIPSGVYGDTRPFR